MMDERSSDEIHWQLMRDDMKRQAVGAAGVSNGVANAADGGQEQRDLRHSPTGAGERPMMKPGRMRIIRARPFLAVIEGGQN